VNGISAFKIKALRYKHGHSNFKHCVELDPKNEKNAPKGVFLTVW